MSPPAAVGTNNSLFVDILNASTDTPPKAAVPIVIPKEPSVP